MDVQKTMDFILEQQAQVFALQAQAQIEMREIRAVLRRAIRLAVQEARHERQRRREVDAQCKARSDEFEARLNLLIEALRKGRNGGGRTGPAPEAS